jgi:peptide/nickel transport system substrate-binding protein
MTIRRRSLIAGSLAAIGGGIALSGCSFDKGSSGSEDQATEVSIAGWDGTTWTRNFNIFSPTATAVTPGSAFVYEPLVRLDRTQAGTIEPYLATEWEFDESGKELTFTLRDDVTWNDGEKFTADDVAFTWQLVLDGKTNTVYPFSSVNVIDDTHVTAIYDDPAFADLGAFANRPVVPEHVWKDEDPSAYTNEEPVGTGPFTVSAFATQQVTLTVRDDHWGEGSKGVKTIKLKANSGDAAKDGLLKGDLDYGTMGWPNGQAEFVDAAPETNQYNFYPTGTCDGIYFNVLEAPFDDAAVRRAMRSAVDLEAAAAAVQVGYAVPTKSGLDAGVYSELLAEDQEQKLDIDGAKKELEDAGWSVEGGKLVKDGESYAITFSVYQEYTEWVLSSQILADQWKTNLGLEVTLDQLADQPYSDVIESGDYMMVTDGPTSGLSITEIVTNYRSSLVGEPGDNANGNHAFFTNDRLDEIGKELSGIEPGTDQDKLKALAVEAQEIFTQECPFIATATAGWKGVFTTRNWKNWPVQGETTWVPNNTLYPDAALTILGIEPA